MTQVIPIRLTKAKLAAMPIAERRLLLLLGHAANEINVYRKLIVMSGQTDAAGFADRVQAGQTFILLRTLIGKLHEAWVLLAKRFKDDGLLAAKYMPLLSTEASAALTRLNKDFGQQSPITVIRNNAAFDYHDEQNLAEQEFHKIPESEPWDVYLSNKGDSFYYASELVIVGLVINLAKKNPDDSTPYLESASKGFERLCRMVIGVAERIDDLFNGCITAIVAQHLLDAHVDPPVEIPATKPLSALTIPFYMAADTTYEVQD